MKSASSDTAVSSSKPAAPRDKGKRQKVAVACQSCRRKKIKCDGERPDDDWLTIEAACSSCRTKSKSRIQRGTCSYQGPSGATAEAARESSVQKAHSYSHGGDLGDPDPLSSETSAVSETPAHLVQGHPPGRFASDINAAVTTKLGPPSADRPTLPHAADVPLFGVLGFHDARYEGIENALPPQKEADKLIDNYWRYIHPLEPFVDRRSLSLSYRKLFADNSGDHKASGSNRILLSTLNAVFAFSTQFQESLPTEIRQETSRTYFHRAWALLRPEAIIWEPASLDMVQCMLLLSRYMQLTNHSHQTWMAIGIAVRAAQSLGLDLLQAAAGNGDEQTSRRRRLWQCCVFMDRTASWTSARVSTIPLKTQGCKPAERKDENDSEDNEILNKTLELYEINNRGLLLYSPDGNSATNPRFCRENDSGVGMVLQLEESVVRWEKGLPLPLRIESFPKNQSSRTESVTYRQAVLLRLRLLHARIVFFKPLLARYCSSCQFPEHALKNKILRDCAVLCIESAQEMIGLVDGEHRPDNNLSSMTWWHRVFYLHVAGSVLLASMLQVEDLFSESVSQSWQTAMLSLRAHAHLSISVQECIATFQTLSEKITEAQHSASEQVSVGTLVGCDRPFSGVNFEDVFQDLGIDLDNCLFGMDDMAWAGNLF